MLNSLLDECPAEPLQTDVVVVGGGLAGLFLAQCLSQKGVSSIVLESGGLLQQTDTHPLNQVEMLGETYTGAEHGRFRCLGGTSTRWGGALLPYLEVDRGPHPLGWHDGWGSNFDDLSSHLPEVERVFGVCPGTYEGEAWMSDLVPGFRPRLPKWPKFSRRSTANLFRNGIHRDRRLSVWIHATVTKILINQGTVEGVVAESPNGHCVQVLSREVVLAAGAIETTRMLLLLNKAYNGSLFPSEMPLGRGFHDHLSAAVADLEVVDKKQITRLFSFRFVRGGMRNLRFELAPETRVADDLPAAFGHVAFSRDRDSGFEGLRKILQSLQRRRLPASDDFFQVLRDMPWFVAAVYWRLFEKSVLPPTDPRFELHLVTEQIPRHENRITLSTDTCDTYGQPLAAIEWRIHDDDRESFWRSAKRLSSAWNEGEISKYANLTLRDRGTVFRDLAASGGIFHPAGTTRIGVSARDGVVDDRLRVYGISGLRALATSVFPSIGGSSPSLALVQLTACIATDIASGIRHLQSTSAAQ